MLGILPSTWFTPDPQWLLLLIIAIAVLLLIRGADWLVDGAAGIAARLGLPKVIIGATVVSLGTTSPEAAVSVLAAIQGNAGLSLGNGVGSIIADTGLIFGLGCLITTLPADRFVLRRHGWIQFGAASLLAVLCYAAYYRQGPDAALSRPSGALLLGLLVLYMLFSVKWSRAHQQGEPHAIDNTQRPAQPRSVPAMLLSGVIGLAIVIFAGDAMVQSASELALRWGVPDAVVAATIVAFGTSLPELVVAISSIRKGHPELLVGNIIGADILNVLFVIGASALASPLHVVERGDAIFLYLHLPAMLAILLLFRVYIFMAMRTGRFSRWMGAPLLLLFVAYVAIQYALSVGEFPPAH